MSLRFTESLWLTPDLDGPGRYKTARAFAFEIGLKGSGLMVVVPEGFSTDLASVPRWLWWLFAPHDPQYAAAAVLHDYLRNWPDFDPMTAHAVFLEAMTILGVPFWKAAAMFAAVVIFDSRRRSPPVADSLPQS